MRQTAQIYAAHQDFPALFAYFMSWSIFFSNPKYTIKICLFAHCNIYDFKGDTSNFIYMYVSFDLTTDLMSKHEVKKMIQKWNILFCLPCSNVISTWLHHPYFYSIVKNNSSSLLSYHLFWYSCVISVRIQQNIRKVQKWPWISPF